MPKSRHRLKKPVTAVPEPEQKRKSAGIYIFVYTVIALMVLGMLSLMLTQSATVVAPTLPSP